MARPNLNGALMVIVLSALYVTGSVILLVLLADDAGLNHGIQYANPEKLIRLNYATILCVGGVLVYAPILYAMDGHLFRRAPQWMYVVFPFAMMIAIYAMAPSLASN